jgi:hypothetical protein
VNSVAEALAELAALDRSTLADGWKTAFGVPAPKSCQATLLRQALAWHVQIEALRAAVGSREADRAQVALRKAARAPRRSQLGPGTRLLREWAGRTHHVTVVAGGFDYEGKTWRSLSAIARQITGTRWSGPLFFGLNE